MNNTQFIEHIANSQAKGLELVKKKNADYAAESNPFMNFEASTVVDVKPERAMLVHILTKITRISNLLSREAAVKDESVEDTIIDTANYLYILLAYRSRNKTISQLPKVGDMDSLELLNAKLFGKLPGSIT